MEDRSSLRVVLVLKMMLFHLRGQRFFQNLAKLPNADRMGYRLRAVEHSGADIISDAIPLVQSKFQVMASL